MIKTLSIITFALLGSIGTAQASEHRDRDGHGRREARTRVHCRSADYNFNRCDTGLNEIYSARVSERKSDARCEYGYSWGIRGSDIWVDRGCEAVFTVHGRR